MKRPLPSDSIRSVPRYALIAPCRDERALRRRPLDTLTAQRRRPANLVFVDVGSTDATRQISSDSATKQAWIRIAARNNRGRRSVRSRVIDAFCAGHTTINPEDFEFHFKSYLDLQLPPGYFEILMSRMRDNPHLPTCSGKAYVYERDSPSPKRERDDSSLGMTRFYSTIAFQQISEFVCEVMLEVCAAMLWGWTWSALNRAPRYEYRASRRFVRRHQRRVRVVGKVKVFAELACGTHSI